MTAFVRGFSTFARCCCRCACSGATHSDMVILDDQGKCVGKAAGGGTNPWVSDTILELVFVIILSHLSK